jgi:hypothetical protein
VKSDGRPCPVCCGPSRTIYKMDRHGFTYRRHQCRHCVPIVRWSSRQYDEHTDPNRSTTYSVVR